MLPWYMEESIFFTKISCEFLILKFYIDKNLQPRNNNLLVDEVTYSYSYIIIIITTFLFASVKSSQFLFYVEQPTLWCSIIHLLFSLPRFLSKSKINLQELAHMWNFHNQIQTSWDYTMVLSTTNSQLPKIMLLCSQSHQKKVARNFLRFLSISHIT